MRPAVNVDDHRVLRVVGQADRLREERLDFELVVVGDERERFDLGEPLAAQHVRVEVGQLAAGDVQLRRIGRASRSV